MDQTVGHQCALCVWQIQEHSADHRGSV